MDIVLRSSFILNTIDSILGSGMLDPGRAGSSMQRKEPAVGGPLSLTPSVEQRKMVLSPPEKCQRTNGRGHLRSQATPVSVRARSVAAHQCFFLRTFVRGG